MLSRRQRVTITPLLLILALVEVDAAQVNAQGDKTKIAGKAIQADNVYNEWGLAQSNTGLKPEERVKSTVNAFFIIKFDSWVQGTLLDFGFPFAQTDPQAYEEGG